MQLGALITRLENEHDAAEMLEAFGDPFLFAEASAAAERYGETPGEYLAASVGQFAAVAGDEDWMGLIATMERADDPGRAAISRILRWALARDVADAAAFSTGCSCAT
jgi:hypothetical protein